MDDKLGEFEELLTHTLRTVNKGRSRLRPPAVAANGRQYDYGEA